MYETIVADGTWSIGIYRGMPSAEEVIMIESGLTHEAAQFKEGDRGLLRIQWASRSDLGHTRNTCASLGFRTHRKAHTLRIVSWNCNGGYSKKQAAVQELQPDIVILQEISQRDFDTLDAPAKHWVGSNPSRGLAVISTRINDLRMDPSYRPDLPWFLPIHAGGLRILAVWACVLSSRMRYVRLVHEAMDHYQGFLEATPSIAIGDFNSNAIFDRKYSVRNHTEMVSRFAELGMVSAWHEQEGEPHGVESSPTFFLYRHRDKPYHFDFAFLPVEILGGSRLEIGSVDEWLTISDHLPLILDVPNNLTGDRSYRSIPC